MREEVIRDANILAGYVSGWHESAQPSKYKKRVEDLRLQVIKTRKAIKKFREHLIHYLKGEGAL